MTTSSNNLASNLNNPDSGIALANFTKSAVFRTVFKLLIVISSRSNFPSFLYNSNFNNNIDHVNLEILNSQLKSIKKYWKFVSIDEYVDAENKKGLASITIDDGYKNIIDESLEVFKNLNIPITIFINSSTFDGKIFWRDKVRYLIENNLVKK